MNYERADLLDKLAAEYVLGSLSGPARRRFERLMRASPVAAQAVLRWQERLMSLAESLPDRAPSDRVWPAIERRLDPPAERSSTARRHWWGLLAPVASLALGVVLGIAMVPQLAILSRPSPVPVAVERGVLPESYVGVLSDASGEAALLAASRRNGKELFVKLVKPLAPPSGRVAVLWALPANGAPFPLGVVPPGKKATLAMADTSEHLLSKVDRLALSFESGLPGRGAAPAPFVLQGHCVKLW